MQTEIADVAKKLTYGTLIIGACLFGIRLLLNNSIALALVFSISVAAAMVPEGLPAQISMALALAVGIAMGKSGSKVAQEAANMILLDDNFSTIVAAIKEGRTIFRNLEKTIKTNLSSNIAELTCVLLGFAGAFFGLATPILAVQILLIDIVGEMFPLIMLTYDPLE